MRAYKTLKPVKVSNCLIRMDPKHVKRYAGKLKKSEDGFFKVEGIIQLKSSMIVATDYHFPKSVIGHYVDLDDVENIPSAEADEIELEQEETGSTEPDEIDLSHLPELAKPDPATQQRRPNKKRNK